MNNSRTLHATQRYMKLNMQQTMRGSIERALVELITNADDSYRDVEDSAKHPIKSKVSIEIERRRKGRSKIIVRDRAQGMSRKKMNSALGDLGGRTSGFEEGKKRRGLVGTGAKDIASFGVAHFESIHDGKYNHFYIRSDTTCDFENERDLPANETIRAKLGIFKNNGTVVTIEVDDNFKIPQHDRLVQDFSRYYSLRDIFSSPYREISLKDIRSGREDKLVYVYPEGEEVFSGKIILPSYPEVEATLVLRKHEKPFQQGVKPYCEGVLVKSTIAIHDCTYFGLEDPLVWMFSGELKVDYIDKLIKDFDDRDEKGLKQTKENNTRLLNPHRDGLVKEHPFAKELYSNCRKILETPINELKKKEEGEKNEVSDEKLDRKLNNLARSVSRLFEERMKEMDELLEAGDIDEGDIDDLALGLHIIPPGEQLVHVGVPKTFSVIVKSPTPLTDTDTIQISNSNPNIALTTKSPKMLLTDSGRTGRTSFKVSGDKVGESDIIKAQYLELENYVKVNIVVTDPDRDYPAGLSFENKNYSLKIGKTKIVRVVLRHTNPNISASMTVKVVSNHKDIVVLKGGDFPLKFNKKLCVYFAEIPVRGRQINAKAVIEARAKGYDLATSRIFVVEDNNSNFKFDFKAVEEDYGAVRYMWDMNSPYLLKIGAKHPTIRKYLGHLKDGKYENTNSPMYNNILAEVIAEALSFRILQKYFEKSEDKGQLDYESMNLYYHKHFSEFGLVAHNMLVDHNELIG